MYYPILSSRTFSFIQVAFCLNCVYNFHRRTIMKELECQLDCKATAGLRDEIIKDFAKKDRPLKELLDENKATEDDEQDSN